MDECDLCHDYSDCLHPVGFRSKFSIYKHGHTINYDREVHDKLLSLEMELAFDRWNGETDPLTGQPDYHSGWSVYLCHDCFGKYSEYIQTWG